MCRTVTFYGEIYLDIDESISNDSGTTFGGDDYSTCCAYMVSPRAGGGAMAMAT